jgi:hypothetical protein
MNQCKGRDVSELSRKLCPPFCTLKASLPAFARQTHNKACYYRFREKCEGGSERADETRMERNVANLFEIEDCLLVG